MIVYLALVLSSAVLCLVLTPVVSRASSALGLVDAPGGRKVHSSSVPRLGGLAIAVAAVLALAAVLVALPLDAGGGRTDRVPRTILPVLAGGAMVLAVGIADDVRGLAPWPKLVVQILAALLVMSSGLLIERITFGGQTWQLGLLAWPVTLLWIVGLTNAFNLIDGVDGLAAGVSIIAGTTCAAILVARGHAAEAMLLAALVGAALGFLVYNFAPATIFLGDGGSLLFGFVLATTAITGWQKGATVLAAGVPLLIFALPIADSASALLRRVLRREVMRPPGPGQEGGWLTAVLRRIVEPDREHIHHRLLGVGLSPRRTVLVLYGLSLLFSAIALATVQFE